MNRSAIVDAMSIVAMLSIALPAIAFGLAGLAAAYAGSMGLMSLYQPALAAAGWLALATVAGLALAAVLAVLAEALHR
jgi:hypothetical protein